MPGKAVTASAAERERIAALAVAAGLPAPRAIALLPGTGNRTFALDGPDGAAIVRLPGGETSALVDRAAECHNASVAAALGVAPRLLHVDARDGAMVVVRAAGQPLGRLDGVRRLDALRRLGAALAILHRGPAFRGVMDPWAKIALYLNEAGLAAPGDPGAFGALWPRLDGLRSRIALDATRLVPCHIDPVPDNAIDDGRRVLLVDWEYAAMSEPLWDLAYACVEGGLDPAGERALLSGYGLGSAEAARLVGWKTMARAVSAAWCMARAATADGPLWRREVASRLAALAADLDHGTPTGGARPWST